MSLDQISFDQSRCEVQMRVYGICISSFSGSTATFVSLLFNTGFR